MKLDRDRKLAVPEKEVERNRRDFLEAYGWTIIPTNASDRKRTGAPAHQRGSLDWVCIRHRIWERRADYYERIETLNDILIIEHKRRLARTDKKRLAAQAAAHAEWERKGFLVYRDKDAATDPIGDFLKFYGEHF